jgi:cyanophycinase-like exopeptidase
MGKDTGQGPKGTLTIIGSGELVDSMATVHRRILELIGEPARPAFVDTPAGFEMNIDLIGEKAVDYYRRNFGLEIEVIRYRSAQKATPAETAAAVRVIQAANYILMGPGSPSYALRNLRATPVFEAIRRRFVDGAHLVFASAAATTLGALSVPVYEIYKVGEDPYWIEGLDILSMLGLRMALVPHWNNNDGINYDTSRCYIGERRLSVLMQQMPPGMRVLGVDEYTALHIRPRDGTFEVFGAGVATLRDGENERIFDKGQLYDLAALAPPEPIAGAEEVEETPLAGPAKPEIAHELDHARQAIQTDDRSRWQTHLYELSLIVSKALESHAHTDPAGAQDHALATEALRAVHDALQALMAQSDEAGKQAPDAEALIELLVGVRDDLRAAKQWALADKIRDGLAEHGISLADTPDGTTWSLGEAG